METSDKRKITKDIAEIKKQCYVFLHFFKIYKTISDEHYTHDKKFSTSKVLEIQISTYASFVEQLLDVLNKNFILDDKSIRDEKPEEELYLNNEHIDDDTVLDGKCTNFLLNLLPKKYKNDSSLLLKSIVFNITNLFTQIVPILIDIDKRVDEPTKVTKVSSIFSDFLKYTNKPFEYINNTLENLNNQDVDVLLFVDERKKQVTEFLGSKFKVEDLKTTDLTSSSFLKKLSQNLNSSREPESIVISGLNSERIDLTTDTSNDEYENNLKTFYEFLLDSLTKFVKLDHFIFICVSDTEIRNKFTSKLKEETLEKAKGEALKVSPKDKKRMKKFIPMKLNDIFRDICKTTKKTLPCLTQDACKKLSEDGSVYNSVKFVSQSNKSSKSRSTSKRAINSIRRAQKKASSSSFGFNSNSNNDYGFTPKRNAKSAPKSTSSVKNPLSDSTETSNRDYTGFGNSNSNSNHSSKNAPPPSNSQFARNIIKTESNKNRLNSIIRRGNKSKAKRTKKRASKNASSRNSSTNYPGFESN